MSNNAMRANRGASAVGSTLLDGLVCVHTHLCSKVEDSAEAKLATNASENDPSTSQPLSVKLQLVEEPMASPPEDVPSQMLQEDDFSFTDFSDEAEPSSERPKELPEVEASDEVLSASAEEDQVARPVETQSQLLDEEVESFEAFILPKSKDSGVPKKESPRNATQKVEQTAQPQPQSSFELNPGLNPNLDRPKPSSLPELISAIEQDPVGFPQETQKTLDGEHKPLRGVERYRGPVSSHPQTSSEVSRTNTNASAESLGKHFHLRPSVLDQKRSTSRVSTIKGHDPFSLFFRAHNDEKLFNLGESFYRDYKNGQRTFGFANVGTSEPQKRSILGIASFIRYFEENSVLILTDKIQESFFQDIFFAGETRTRSVPKTEIFYSTLEYHGIHFIQVSELAAQLRNNKGKVKPQMVHAIFDEFDVVFCDLPSLEERKQFYDVYLPVLKTHDHVT